MSHTNLNYHSIAYEKIDHYMRNVIEVLSNSPLFFQNCMACINESLETLPSYLSDNLQVFQAKILDCVPPEYPYGDIARNETAELHDANREDQHCKSRRIHHLQLLIDSISARTQAWLQHVKDNPSVKGF